MARTMDEQLFRELDTLWQMALFLEGGDQAGAEELLAESIAEVLAEDADMAERWHGEDAFEQVLLKRFFQSSPQVPAGRPAGSVVSGVISEGLDLHVLLDEAGRLPERVRAALWLMLIRRRSFDDTASILGIETVDLRPLLPYRDRFMTRVVMRTAGRIRDDLSGTSGAAP